MALPKLYDTNEAAAYLGFKPRTLEVQRRRGNGPRYRKLGTRTVRYTEDNLLEWLDRGARDSTSDG